MADERIITIYINPRLETLQEIMEKLTRQLKGMLLEETHVIFDPKTKKELARRTPDGQWSIKHDTPS